MNKLRESFAGLMRNLGGFGAKKKAMPDPTKGKAKRAHLSLRTSESFAVAKRRAMGALRKEAKAEAVERKRRLDIAALRKERKVRAAKKIKKVSRVKRREKGLRILAKERRGLPSESEFASTEHGTSKKRYSWKVEVAVYNGKTDNIETRNVAISTNVRLTDREVKEKAWKAVVEKETSPDLELIDAKILENGLIDKNGFIINGRTIDREYKEVIRDGR